MTITIAGLFGFVVLAIVVGLVAYGLTLIVGRAPMDEAIKTIVVWAIGAIALLIVLWALLAAVGLVSGVPLLSAK